MLEVPVDLSRYHVLLRLTYTMQYLKIVLILAAFAATFHIARQTYASRFQDTKQTASIERKTVPVEYLLRLTFEDAIFREFVKISPKQLELLGSLSKEWAVERERLADAGASYRDQYRALEAKEAKLTDTFTEFQRQQMLRFNLITSWGFDEFGTLERANAAGDLTVTDAQIQELQSLKNKWVDRIDQDLVLPTENPLMDREEQWELLNEHVRMVQEIRDANNHAFLSELNACLSQEQVSRLAQIQLQKQVSISAIDTFNVPAIQNGLELTRDQTEQLAELRLEIANEEDRFLAIKMKIDAYKTYFDSLSPAQIDAWRKKLGPPSWLFPVEWLAEHIETDQKIGK